MPEEPTIKDVHASLQQVTGKIERCAENVDKVITGLYGDLSEPGTGFINETKTKLQVLNSNVKILLIDKEERNKDKKWTLRAAITAIAGATAAMVKAFFFNGTQTP